MIIRRKVLVSGRVQGVGFRASTERRARQEAALGGYVRNLEDGRVEAVFQGDEAAVLALVAWCATGPSQARVERVQVIEESPETGTSSEFGIQIESEFYG